MPNSKKTIRESSEKVTLTSENILNAITNEWKSLESIIPNFLIKDRWDLKFVMLKLREFERKELIISKDGKQWKKVEVKTIKPNLEKEKVVKHNHINWKPQINKLTRLSLEIYKDQEFTEKTFIQKLSQIFIDFKLIKNTDNRTIAFLEFCFYKADGPYSRKFAFLIIVLRKVFAVYPPLRKLIDKTGAAAIGNMTLGAIGGLKFKISDLYELKQVLRAWSRMGLRRVTINSVFYAVRNKYIVKRGISEQAPLLLARLKAIFPMYQEFFISSNLNLNQALYDHFKERFEKIISDYKEKGLSIEEMIQKENERELPVGVKRNNLLSFLVRKANGFKCELCKTEKKRSYTIQTHHIIPLSEGGEDHSQNMIVLCESHHDSVHDGEIMIERDDQKTWIKYYPILKKIKR